MLKLFFFLNKYAWYCSSVLFIFTVHWYCSCLLFIGTVHVYCSSVLFTQKNFFFLVYLTLQTFDNMQELYFIKCLLVIHARNDASKIIF